TQWSGCWPLPVNIRTKRSGAGPSCAQAIRPSSPDMKGAAAKAPSPLKKSRRLISGLLPSRQERLGRQESNHPLLHALAAEHLGHRRRAVPVGGLLEAAEHDAEPLLGEAARQLLALRQHRGELHRPLERPVLHAEVEDAAARIDGHPLLLGAV